LFRSIGGLLCPISWPEARCVRCKERLGAQLERGVYGSFGAPPIKWAQRVFCSVGKWGKKSVRENFEELRRGDPWSTAKWVVSPLRSLSVGDGTFYTRRSSVIFSCRRIPGKGFVEIQTGELVLLGLRVLTCQFRGSQKAFVCCLSEKFPFGRFCPEAQVEFSKPVRNWLSTEVRNQGELTAGIRSKWNGNLKGAVKLLFFPVFQAPKALSAFCSVCV